MRTVTPFDTSKHHIHINFFVTDSAGKVHRCTGVVDTGAPWTELNDLFLSHAGLIASPPSEVPLKPELETQKYCKLKLPSVAICGQTIDDFSVMVSRFDEAWGIAALIGLDFFRRFRVTIDYGSGELVCEPLRSPLSSVPPARS